MNSPTVPPAAPASGAAPDNAPPTGPTVAQKAARGASWAFVQVIASKLLAALAQVVLGWLLLKEDFGQISLTYTVTTFVSLLTLLGIDVVLVQRHRRIDRWVTPAVWMSVAAGLLGAAITLAAAPLAAAVYGDPELLPLVSLAALAAPATALSLTPRGMLEAEMRHPRVSATVFLGAIVNFVTAVSLARAGWGPYSMIIATIASESTITSLYWWQVRPKFGLNPQFHLWRYILGDTSYLFAYRLTTMVISQGDYIILGLLCAPAVVGVYFFAYWYAVQGSRLVGAAIGVTLFTAFARFQGDPQRQADAAMRSARTVAMVCVPVGLLQGATAQPLFTAVFGGLWDEAVPLVQLMSLGFASDAVSWVGIALMQAQRRFGAMVKISLAFMTVFLTAVAVGAVQHQALGVAVAVALFYLLVTPLTLYLAVRPFGVPFSRVVRVYVRPWLASLVAFPLAMYVGRLVAGVVGPGQVGAAAETAAVVAVGLGLYWALVRVLMPEDYRYLLHRLLRR